MKTFLSLLTCITLVLTTEAFPSFSSSQHIHLCGDQLVQALALVCGGVYNEPRSKKSELGGSIYSNRLWAKALESGESPAGFDGLLNSRAALSFLGKRQIRGVINECCERSCNYYVLRSYCGANPSALQFKRDNSEKDAFWYKTAN